MANLIILILPIAAIFLMFRSQKKRQAQQQHLQANLQAGAGVRTIGGIYALVKSVNEDSIELEIAPGVTTHFIKSAVAVVLEPLEYDAIINGRPAEDEDLESAEDLEHAADLEHAEDTEVEDKPLSVDKKSDDVPAKGEAPESK